MSTWRFYLLRMCTAAAVAAPTATLPSRVSANLSGVATATPEIAILSAYNNDTEQIQASPSPDVSPPPWPTPSMSPPPAPMPPSVRSPSPAQQTSSGSSPSLLLFLAITTIPLLGLAVLFVAYADPSYACSSLPSLRRLLARQPRLFDQPMEASSGLAPMIMVTAALVLLEMPLASTFAEMLWSLLEGGGATSTYALIGVALLAAVWLSVAAALRSPEAKQYAAVNDEDASSGANGDGDVTVREAFVIDESAATRLSVAAIFGDASDTAHALFDLLITGTVQLGMLMLFSSSRAWAAAASPNEVSASSAQPAISELPVMFLTRIFTGLIMLLKAGESSVGGFRLMHLHARVLLLRASQGFSLRCDAEDDELLFAARAPSFALSLLLAVLGSLQAIVPLFAVELGVQIASSQQSGIKDLVIGLVALLFLLDLDKGWVRSSLFRPFRHTITHQGEVRHLEPLGCAAASRTITAEWRTIAHASADGGPPAFSKMESYPTNTNYGWQHAQFVMTLLGFRYALVFCLSQREGLLTIVGDLDGSDQLLVLLRRLARICFGALLGLQYADRVARVGKAWQLLLTHLVLLLALHRSSVWASERAAEVYGSSSPATYIGELVSVTVRPFALACFYAMALGRPSGELEVEHEGQVVMREIGLALSSWLAFCSFAVHFGCSLLPTDALGLLFQTSATSVRISHGLDLFTDEVFKSAGRETVDAFAFAMILLVCSIICWQLGVYSRQFVTKISVDWSVGANEAVVLAPLSCTLLAVLGKILLDGAPGSDGVSMQPSLFLLLVALATCSFLVAEPVWQGRLHSARPSTQSSSKARSVPPTKQLMADAKVQQQSAETAAAVSAIADAVVELLEQVASTKNKPADAIERLQTVRLALEAVQLQRWPPGSGRASGTSLSRFAPPPQISHTPDAAATPANQPQRCCPDERSRPLGQPPTPQRSGSFPARSGGGAAGKRRSGGGTPGGTPGVTPRTPKDPQLSSRRWGCAGS